MTLVDGLDGWGGDERCAPLVIQLWEAPMSSLCLLEDEGMQRWKQDVPLSGLYEAVHIIGVHTGAFLHVGASADHSTGASQPNKSCSCLVTRRGYLALGSWLVTVWFELEKLWTLQEERQGQIVCLHIRESQREKCGGLLLGVGNLTQWEASDITFTHGWKVLKCEKAAGVWSICWFLCLPTRYSGFAFDNRPLFVLALECCTWI